MFPQIFGKYVLERELAAGGMARVFLATLRGAKGFEKRLVVKQIRPELASDQAFIQRFVSEAKTTVELSHSNIVPVYELGVEQGIYYIALEFCEGVPLSELLALGVLSPAEGAYVGVEICRALDYAHRRALIVHRDVTPRNVMVDPEGMVRLIDFGIAAPAASEGAARERGPIFGSPGHMPPEQLSGARLTPAADVFAVGALLIEAWTGRAPFRRETPAASARCLGEPRPNIAASIPELAPLSELVTLAVDSDSHKRPQSAEELARPLREFLKASELGDLARRLGARVSECLEQQGLQLQRQSARSAGGKAAPLASGGHTLTFASAEAVRDWTGKIESESSESGASSPAPSRRASLLAAFGLGAACLVAAAYWREGASPARGASVARQAQAPPAAAAAPLGIALANAVPPVAPQAAAEENTNERVQVAARAPAPLAAVSDARARAQQPKVAVPAPAREPAASARLSLTADPPAQVELDHVKVGRTPLINLSLRPGRHSVVFTSPALGEDLKASVDLAAAAPRSVHADFTSASPQLYVR